MDSIVYCRINKYLQVIDKLNNEYGANMSLDVGEQEFYNNISEYSVQRIIGYLYQPKYIM